MNIPVVKSYTTQSMNLKQSNNNPAFGLGGFGDMPYNKSNFTSEEKAAMRKEAAKVVKEAAKIAGEIITTNPISMLIKIGKELKK